MSREQNIKNLKTEKDEKKVLKFPNPNFLVPRSEERKRTYKKCKIDYSKYSRSFDGIILNVDSIVEIKTTKSKSVKELPFGVFLVLQKMRSSYLLLNSIWKLTVYYYDTTARLAPFGPKYHIYYFN